jgi:hypothetical protein
LAKRTAGRRVFRRIIKIALRAESQVEEIAHPIYSPLAGGDVPIETTILGSPGWIELHLSARGTEANVVEAALDHAVRRLADALGPSVASVEAARWKKPSACCWIGVASDRRVVHRWPARRSPFNVPVPGWFEAVLGLR